jgi:DNA-binding transcriptional ArsR family regulator
VRRHDRPARRPVAVDHVGPPCVLVKAGLVTSQRVGQWNYFKRDEEVIKAFIDQMQL